MARNYFPEREREQDQGRSSSPSRIAKATAQKRLPVSGQEDTLRRVNLGQPVPELEPRLPSPGWGGGWCRVGSPTACHPWKLSQLAEKSAPKDAALRQFLQAVQEFRQPLITELEAARERPEELFF